MHPEIPAKMLDVGYEYVSSLHHGREEVARGLVCGNRLANREVKRQPQHKFRIVYFPI
jgi:hypothetical protein